MGKSAFIVRYTTGRYIQDYSGSTNDWLYRHSLGFEPKRNASITLELIEQKDVQFENWANFFPSSPSSCQNQLDAKSLCERVAMDQRNDDRAEILSRIRWADAFVVLYAINDSNSFNKAIKYLNLIANNPSDPRDPNRSRLSPPTPQMYQSSNSSSNGSSHSNIPASLGASSLDQPTPRRPILLIANKHDLEATARQVIASDGRHLATRHQSLFAEISVAQSNKLIDENFLQLVELIDLSWFSIASLSQKKRNSADFDPSRRSSNPRALPTIELALSQSTLPVWATGVSSALIDRLEPAESNLENEVFLPDSQDTTQSLASQRNIKRTPSNGSRYKNLKSSFKRASLAIVSSRALLREANKIDSKEAQREPMSDKRSQTNDSIGQTQCNPLTSSNESMKSKTKGSANGNSSTHYANLVSDRLKRSILKYRSRRKTVAFENISTPSGPNLTANVSPTGDDSARSSIDRSSSSLSNSETGYYRSLFVSLRPNQRASSSAGSTSLSSISGTSGYAV